jgi:hypothetical protein
LGVTVTDGEVVDATAKVIGAVPASPLVAFATVIWHFASAVEVPHVPVPTVPVATLNGVEGKVPVALTVTGVAPARAQPAELVAVVRHSMM